MPGRVFWSRSSSTAPARTRARTQTRGSAREVAASPPRPPFPLHPLRLLSPPARSRRSCHIPCEMVLRSSSRLRKESEATWGFPQRSVSSSTSSSNLIQRAVSFHCISWFLSMVSSFSSTNTCGRAGGRTIREQRPGTTRRNDDGHNTPPNTCSRVRRQQVHSLKPSANLVCQQGAEQYLTVRVLRTMGRMCFIKKKKKKKCQLKKF